MSTKLTVFRLGVALAAGEVKEPMDRSRHGQDRNHDDGPRSRPGQFRRDGQMANVDPRDGGSHSTRVTAGCSALQGSWMVNPGGTAGVRVSPFGPVPGQPRGCGKVSEGQVDRKKLTRNKSQDCYELQRTVLCCAVL